MSADSSPKVFNVREDYPDATNHIEEEQVSASDQLAAIQARLAEDENEYSGGVVDQSVRDRRYLIALVLEQRARLGKLLALADVADIHDQHFGDGNGGSLTTEAIRAALTAAEGAEWTSS